MCGVRFLPRHTPALDHPEEGIRHVHCFGPPVLDTLAAMTVD
ncbi:hypothetical protein ACF05L_36625 [Streptomyces bobili]